MTVCVLLFLTNLLNRPPFLHEHVKGCPDYVYAKRRRQLRCLSRQGKSKDLLQRLSLRGSEQAHIYDITSLLYIYMINLSKNTLKNLPYKVIRLIKNRI